MAIFLCIDAISSQNMHLGERCLSRAHHSAIAKMHLRRFDGANGEHRVTNGLSCREHGLNKAHAEGDNRLVSARLQAPRC
jgi:hypothetical protein